MSSQPQDLLMEHNYDGIQEYDNPTPGWWWGLFHLTVVFSIAYFAFYHLGTEGATLKQSYEAAVAANLRLQFGEIGDLKPDEATMLKYMKDAKWLTVGQITFKSRCVTCHGSNAEGQVGPNLTDDNWKNVKKLTDIITVIQNGANNLAMPEWKTKLHPNEIILTASYIASLRGTNLPGPRGPEGDLIPPWPTSAAADHASETQPAPATEPKKG
ncbi:MAG: cbb3-type cytochrome c oxidase N-terminal domain-containing protein [Phycisphaerae bacterium]